MPVLEIESALTDRYQTTVPDAVRRALKLRKRDRIVYRVLEDATVVLARKSARDEDDPVVSRFLAFLARDLDAHPERIRAVDQGLVERIGSLVGNANIDLDTPLAAEDE